MASLGLSGEEDRRNKPAGEGPDGSRKIMASARCLYRLAAIGTVYLALPGLIYGLAYTPVIDGNACFFHDSEFLVPMNEVGHGAVPFRDIYLQHGLFHNAWIPWLGAVLFEPTLAGVRTIMGYIAPLSLLAVYYMVLKTFRFGWLSAPVAALVFLAAGIGGRGSLGFLTIAVLGGSLERPCGFSFFRPLEQAPGASPDTRLWRQRVVFFIRHGKGLILAGFLAMLAFWHSLEVGLYALATGFSLTVLAGIFQGRHIAIRVRALPLAGFTLGAGLGFWLVGWYFLVHGALVDLWSNLWLQCVYQVETWGLAFPGFFETFQPIASSSGEGLSFADWIQTGNVQFYLGGLALVLAVFSLTGRAFGDRFWNSAWAPQLLLLTLAGSFFYRTVLGRSDLAHTHYSLFFSTLLSLFAVAALSGRGWDFLADRGRTLKWRLIGGLSFLLPALIGGLVMTWYVQLRWQPVDNLATRWRELWNPPPPTLAHSEPLERAGILNMGNRPAEMEAVIEYIRKHTGPREPVFDFSNQALWLFLADRPPASPYFLTAYASPPHIQHELVASLERRQVDLVIYSGNTWFDRIDGVPQVERHPVIAEYLHAYFAPVQRVGRVEFWRRQSAYP